jgi:hypothetical protein
MNLRKLGIGVVVPALFAAGLWSGIGSANWSSSGAAPIGLTAALVPGKEVPKPTGVRAGAGGRFVATLVRRGTGGTMAWRLTFHDLTGRATAAHIHLARPGRSGNVAVPLCGPCRSGVRGKAKVNARTVRALLAGRAYANVHTVKNPGGEIRGQIKKAAKLPLPAPTPSPTTTTTTTTTYDPYP